MTLNRGPNLTHMNRRSSFFMSSYSIPGYEHLLLVNYQTQFGVVIPGRSRLFPSLYKKLFIDNRFRHSRVRDKQTINNYNNYNRIWQYRVFAARYFYYPKGITFFPIFQKKKVLNFNEALCIHVKYKRVILQGPYTRFSLRFKSKIFNTLSPLRRQLAFIYKIINTNTSYHQKLRKIASGLYRQPFTSLVKNHKSKILPAFEMHKRYSPNYKEKKHILSRKSNYKLKRIKTKRNHKKRKKQGKPYLRLNFFRGSVAKRKRKNKRFWKSVTNYELNHGNGCLSLNA